MARICNLFQVLVLGLASVSFVEALDLNTFSGQAIALSRQREMALGQHGAKQEIQPMRMKAEGDADDDDELSCTKKKGCKKGCCGPLDSKGVGVCGTGPKFCGKDCTSECDYKSECDPGWGLQYSNFTECPLNVCCSEYGFCGTLPSYCKGETVASPQCSRDQHTSDKRTVGYYEGWNFQKPCGNMEPEDIPLGYYTHINFAFVLINPETYRIDPMDDGTASRYDRVTRLKQNQEDLEVWIAIGGWAMNDPGKYRTVFSDLAKSEKKQDAFFDSLISFMQVHSFDGVDLDWEYPVAEDRGGIEEDFDNYPASYWYLKGFDIVNMEKYLDWFNIMTYDIHGIWDQDIEALGPHALAHTNLTEIHQGLELLWRNNINPERVVLGLGFYGRSFTMKSPDCLEAGCEFEEGAKKGKCSGTEGVLSAHEISEIIKDGAKVTLDEKAGVKIVTWDSNQWVSWDDAETLKMKLDYANEHCLGGTMVWAIDLDDGTMIEALGKGMKRKKSLVVKSPKVEECFGTGGRVKDEL
ncbi:glycoside hydrolase family 18 [Fusarium longipes]|uniref:chitinase n=1 Tax=Fusarium longipes TaxID=694270 RepID=A0A395TAS2_9HYPO|nr:glycoside hydrolase family 18 [Fusarium longipes]